MGSVCISSAAILRCSCLTRTQNIVLFVPAALELLSSTCLVYFKWRSGRIHLLLTAEGWIYFSLALLELLSATPPLSQSTPNAIRTIDIGIGIASFLPLLFYTLFLYLFTSRDLLTNLPPYVRNVAKVALFVALPSIIATNEVASVVGLQITVDKSRVLSSFQFSTKHDEWFWLLFTSLTLAILTAFQATVFSFSFFRLIWILVQRGRDNNNFELLGVPWISAGVKLGALESVVGFAGGGFEVSLARRIMRFLARASLCIGVIKGVDSTAGPDANFSPYNNLEDDEKNRSRLSKIPPFRMNLMISNPRLSTFQELTPTATAFHSAPRGAKTQSPPHNSQRVVGIKAPHYYSQRHSLPNVQYLGIPGTSQFASIKETSTNKQRVTVLYDVHGGPPLLHMRFSTLDVPSPSLMADGVQSRPAGTFLSPEVDTSQRNCAQLSCPSGQLFSTTSSELDLEDEVLTMPKLPFAHERKTSGSSGMSISSVTPSVVEIISVPRRTISQRRAEARVFRADSVKAQVTVEDGKQWNSFGEPTFDTTNRKDVASARYSEQMRISSAGTFGHSDPIPVVPHTRTESGSISIKSIPDSIQAVQELARQFPCLPQSASVVDVSPETSNQAKAFHSEAAAPRHT